MPEWFISVLMVIALILIILVTVGFFIVIGGLLYMFICEIQEDARRKWWNTRD